MPDPGAVQLDRLAARLRAAGTEGQGLRRELMKAITKAAEPLAKKISSLEHLEPYLPDPYAAILAKDLKVSASKSFSGDPKVSVVAQARQRKRKVVLLDNGFINHPVYARGPRKTWNWSSGQTGGMKAGFFSDATREAAPEIRERVMAALVETGRKVADG
jgi:hypothetical protein